MEGAEFGMSEGYLPVFPFILPTPTGSRPAEWVGRRARPPTFLTLRQGLSVRDSIPLQEHIPQIPHWTCLREYCRSYHLIELAVWAKSSPGGIRVGVIANKRWAVRWILSAPDSPSAPPRQLEDWACLWVITFLLTAFLSPPETRRPRVYTMASRLGAGLDRYMGASVRRIISRFPAGFDWVTSSPELWGRFGSLACDAARWGCTGFPMNVSIVLTTRVILERDGMLGALSPGDPVLRADIEEAQRTNLLLVPTSRLRTVCGCTIDSIPCRISSGELDTLHLSVAVLSSQNDLPCVGVVVGPSFTWHFSIDRGEMGARGTGEDRRAWMYCFIMMVIQTEMRGTVAVCLKDNPIATLNSSHLGFTYALLRMQKGSGGAFFRPCPGGCCTGCNHASSRLTRLQCVRGWAPIDNRCDYAWSEGGWEARCDYPVSSLAPPSILSPHIPRATSPIELGRAALLHFVARLCSSYCLWFVPSRVVGREVFTLLSPRRDDRAFSVILPICRAPGFEVFGGNPDLVRLNVTFPGGLLAARTIYTIDIQSLLPLLHSLVASQQGRPWDYNYLYGMTPIRACHTPSNLGVRPSWTMEIVVRRRSPLWGGGQDSSALLHLLTDLKYQRDLRPPPPGPPPPWVSGFEAHLARSMHMLWTSAQAERFSPPLADPPREADFSRLVSRLDNLTASVAKLQGAGMSPLPIQTGRSPWEGGHLGALAYQQDPAQGLPCPPQPGSNELSPAGLLWLHEKKQMQLQLVEQRQQLLEQQERQKEAQQLWQQQEQQYQLEKGQRQLELQHQQERLREQQLQHHRLQQLQQQQLDELRGKQVERTAAVADPTGTGQVPNSPARKAASDAAAVQVLVTSRERVVPTQVVRTSSGVATIPSNGAEPATKSAGPVLLEATDPARLAGESGEVENRSIFDRLGPPIASATDLLLGHPSFNDWSSIVEDPVLDEATLHPPSRPCRWEEFLRLVLRSLQPRELALLKTRSITPTEPSWWSSGWSPSRLLKFVLKRLHLGTPCGTDVLTFWMEVLTAAGFSPDQVVMDWALDAQPTASHSELRSYRLDSYRWAQRAKKNGDLLWSMLDSICAARIWKVDVGREAPLSRRASKGSSRTQKGSQQARGESRRPKARRPSLPSPLPEERTVGPDVTKDVLPLKPVIASQPSSILREQKSRRGRSPHSRGSSRFETGTIGNGLPPASQKGQQKAAQDTYSPVGVGKLLGKVLRDCSPVKSPSSVGSPSPALNPDFGGVGTDYFEESCRAHPTSGATAAESTYNRLAAHHDEGGYEVDEEDFSDHHPSEEVVSRDSLLFFNEA